jgi:hypothetical protein
MEHITNIYNNNSYISNNPSLHTEDSDFKYNNFKQFLDKIELKDNHIKILDIGGGAGLLGLYVLNYFENLNIDVTMHALDLSLEMLKVQVANNPKISKTFNCTLEECPVINYDLALMIDVIEHIPNHTLAAKTLNKISRNIIYNIPVEINGFDVIRNIYNKFNFYKEQTRLLGHVHFFTKISAVLFLKKHHLIVKGYFVPYCFMIKNSKYVGYAELRKSKFRNLENRISCFFAINLKFLSPYLIQGSYYALVKSSII